MKKSFILFLIIFLVFFSSYPAQAGYWKLSGNGVVEKSIVSEGSQTVTLYSSDSNHIDVSVEFQGNQWPMVRAEFRWDTPPQIIRKGEVIPVSLSYSFKSAAQQGGCGVGLSSPYQGLVTLILFDVNSNNPIPPTGQIINTQNRAPNGPESDVFIKYTCGLNGGSTQYVSFPYKWVEDETPTPGITPRVTVTSTTPVTGTIKEIFSNNNIGGVSNNPASPTTFTLDDTYKINMITTYHWNNGRGASPGTIGLKDSRGNTLGTWTATTTRLQGQGGVPNAYWDVAPDIILGPGTYTIVDSDPSTWSQNSESNSKGIAVIKGTKWSGTPTTGKTPGVTVTSSYPDKGTPKVTVKNPPSSPQGDFTVSISPTEMTVDPGENIRFTLTVEPEGDFNEPVEIYVKTEALGIEKDYGRVKIINPPYKPYVFEKQVPDSIPKGTTITGYVTAKGGGLERDAGTVTVNVPGFGTLLAIGALGLVTLLRKRR